MWTVAAFFADIELVIRYFKKHVRNENIILKKKRINIQNKW